VLPVAALLIAGGSLSACADGEMIVTVEHGPVPTPVYVDLGDTGPSAGDQRIFHFDGDHNGDPVTMDWIMTTTAVDAPAADVETRTTSAVFAFGGLDDTLLLSGVGWYPSAEATFEVSASLVRSVVGGTGRYEGMTGWVESTRLPDDTWTHVFHLR